jgi:dTDP-4-dehydrorhamnose reductase
MLKIIITGGSGRLGSRLIEMCGEEYGDSNVFYPTHSEMNVEVEKDIILYVSKNGPFDICIHCAAFSNQRIIEENGDFGNIIGTAYLARLTSYPLDFYFKKLVFISTEYVYANNGISFEDSPVLPMNRYIWSKLGGECAVRQLPINKYLIIRCAFSDKPWPKDKAPSDQLTSREDVDTIAKKIMPLLKDAYGTYNIGQEGQSTLQYARSISPRKEIVASSITDANVPLPRNTRMSMYKYNDFMAGQNDKVT